MISARTGHVLRILTIAAFVASGVLAWRLLDGSGSNPVEEPDPAAEAYDVKTAIAVSKAQPMTVTGFVFDGPGSVGLRMCNGRRGSNPPRCVGPFLGLEQVDAGSFELRQGKLDGRPYGWSPEPVTMTGILVGTVFTVQVVLN